MHRVFVVQGIRNAAATEKVYQRTPGADRDQALLPCGTDSYFFGGGGSLPSR
jgi:hypothetical protein